MSKMACPGQDMRFWGPDDIFEVECGHCGHCLEFFRDDASRRCPQCGERVINPKLAFGCAQWCEYAEKCLGFDPTKIEVMGEQESSLADQLIEAVKAEFGDDHKRIKHALMVLQRAQELLRTEDADPRIVVAAALLHDIGIQQAEKKHGSSAAEFQELEGPPIARRIMEDLDIDELAIKHVCRIVGSHHTAKGIDTPEFLIIWDADCLVNFHDECSRMAPERLEAFVEKTFRTASGRAAALREFVLSDENEDGSDPAGSAAEK